MASITITIPDQHLQRVINGLCLYADPANPVPATGPNAKAALVKWIKSCVYEYEQQVARQAITVDVSDIAT